MKTTLLALMAVTFFSQNSYAVTAFCSQDKYRENSYDEGGPNPGNYPGFDRDWSSNHQVLFQEKLGDFGTKRGTNDLHCKVLDVDGLELTSENVDMSLEGIGMGFRWTALEGIMIHCPLVTSVDRLIKTPFFGVKVAAAVAVGVDVGVFSNKRAGVCALSGFQVGSIGAGISGARMTFSRGR